MNRREFQLADDKSNKFWAVEWEGAALTVRYGRIGTSGQTQQKSFPSEEAAHKEREKLIAEKTKKGYQEVGATSAATVPTAGPAPTNSPTAKLAKENKDESETQPVALAESLAAAEAPPTPTASVPLEHSIRLSPADRFAVTWEDHEPLPKSLLPPFNLENALQRLRSVGDGIHMWGHDWHKARIPKFPSPVEAQFWLMAHQECWTRKQTPQAAAQTLSQATLDGKMSIEQIAAVCAKSWHGTRLNVFGCAAALLSPNDYIRMGELVESGGDYDRSFGLEWANGFRQAVLPYLSVEDQRRQREYIGIHLRQIGFVGLQARWPGEYWIGATLGCHQEVAAILRHIPDGYYNIDAPGMGYEHYYRPQWLAFGLPNAAAVKAEFARLGLRLRGPDDAREWLALTGYSGLELIVQSASIHSKEWSIPTARTLLLVTAPEAAIPALQLVLFSSAQNVGQEWLTQNPLQAAVGLVPAAMGQGKLAKAAREHLRLMHRAGQASILETAAAHLLPEQAAWLQGEMATFAEETLPEIPAAELPETLRAAFAAAATAKMPDWLLVGALPPIKIRNRRLAQIETARLVSELKQMPAGASSALLQALKEHATADSLDTFAWELFEHWLRAGAISKDKWALGAVGHFGGDASVLKLTPLVRQWPGESQHQRAVLGLDCLRAIGSDTSLMALNGIAQKLKFKALKEKAQTLMEGIAQTRGLSREQLADRIVPDCDLDERGSRVFDFGPRQFRFALGPEMKPMVRDAAGKVRPDLPTPNNSDDPEKANSAVAAWKLLKKTLREVLKVQAERLEDAMISGRRWTPEEFRALLVKHPLMVNLARQLVFAAYDDAGKIARTFRVTEDQTAADQNDDDIDLPTTGQIGVVHPAQLDDAAKNAWGQVLSDYEIIPPFQQMSRAIIRPEPADWEAEEITRYKGPKVPGIVMYGMLERSQWLRDTPADAGCFMQHSKHFPAANLTAFIAYEPGLSMGYYDEPQELKSVYFVSGHVKPEWWGNHKNHIKIKDVDSVVLSEVLRLANAIAAKAM